MKRKTTGWLAVSAALGIGPVPAIEFANIGVVQNDNLNNPTSVTLTKEAGSTAAVTIEGGNRGDWDVWFGTPEDITGGVALAVVSENGRDNSAGGDPAGSSYGTAATERQTALTNARRGKFFIPLFATSDSVVASGNELNMDTAVAFFPFAEGWVGGTAYNSTNGGVITALVSGSELAGNKLVLGTHFVDNGGGRFTLDLAPFFGATAPADGVLLVCGAKNEDNYALSRANGDGTFTVFCKDNGTVGASLERDPVAFVYLPESAVGSHGLEAVGRVNSDGTTDVAAGTFTVTKGGAGVWYLQIAGQDGSSGVLLVSPCRGADTDNNVDNVVSYQWDGANNRWEIQSRDLANFMNLQDGASGGEDMFEFAYLALVPTAPNPAPTVALSAPVRSNVPLGSTVNLTATAGDPGGAVAAVRFGRDGMLLAEDTSDAYEASYVTNVLGAAKLEALAVDNLGAKRSSAPVYLITVPPAGSGGLFCNGFDSHVALGDPAELKLETFTIECWFKPEAGGVATSTGATGVSAVPLVTKGRDEAEGGNLDLNYFLGIDTAGRLVADFEDSNGANHPATGVTVVTAGAWQHAAATWDGAELRLYLNGNLETTVASAFGPRSDSIQRAGLGTAFNSAGVAAGAFLGSLDEVRIWNVARSAAQIQQTLNADIGAALPGLVARWGMSEGAGATITSTAAGALAGTLVNEPAWVEGNTFSGLLPPSVAITAPATGNLPVNTVFQVTADANDLDGAVTQVEFFANGVSLGVDTNEPFAVSWNKPPLGSYTLTASAVDDDGQTAGSEPVVVQVAISPAPQQVSFQQGVDGYTGTFDMSLGSYLDGVSGADTALPGATVSEYFLDGDNGSNSPDLNGFVRFDNLIGAGAGQVPEGATVLKARLTITTATASANAMSGGPWVVARVVLPPGETSPLIDAGTVYQDIDINGDPLFRGLRAVTDLPEGGQPAGGGFGDIANGEVVATDVTRIVQAWADGESNEGFAIFDYYETDGWQICTTGNPDPAKRPKLEVWYTTDSVDTYVFEAEQSLLFDTAGTLTADGSTIESIFMDLNDPSPRKRESLFGFGPVFGSGIGRIPADATVRQAFFIVSTSVGTDHQSSGGYLVRPLVAAWDPLTDFGTDGLQEGVEVGPPVATLYGMGQSATQQVDVTSAIIARQGGAPNHGFALTPLTTDGWSIFFPGSTIEQVRPRLVVIASGGTAGGDGFTGWAGDNGIAVDEEDDSDGDGIPALVEYGLGFDPTAFDALPGLVPAEGGGFTLTYQKGAQAAADPAISYVIETSTTLAAGDWQPAADQTDYPDQIEATLPAGLAKIFARLRVDRTAP